MGWHVYVARCGDGSLYTGITTDPARRERAHNAGRGASYTRARRPVRLVHLEPAADRGAALRRELAIKRLSREAKERLVAQTGGREGVKARGREGGRTVGRSDGRTVRRSGVQASGRAGVKAGGGSAAAAREFRGFGAGALRFLKGLARHNTRDWFERNRAVYETEVRDPMRALVEEMDVRLARVAPELVGDPRHSIFRIHRDVRFSADKTPYKTNAACQFYHCDAGRGAGQDAEGAGAGLYFQLADGECFVAGGIWMPARPALEKIREALAEDHESLERIVRAPAFRRRFGELSREKSFTAYRPLTEREATSTRLPVTLERDFAALVPLVRWLNGAIGYRAMERRY